ncbi:MAG: HEAT repeat domain-containing protein [Planctomycetota bacterium]|nr:HEAT repeat domain-containing protein [Planctomycetota bacterium]
MRAGTALGLLVALVWGAAALSRPGGESAEFMALKGEFRSLGAQGLFQARAPAKDRFSVLQRILRLKDQGALEFLAGVVRDDGHDDLREDLLRLLAEERPDTAVVTELLKQQLGADNPQRRLARDLLLQWTKEKKDVSFALELMDKGTIEDRFAAMKLLGEVSHASTLQYVSKLLAADWEPDREAGVTCGALALSLARMEGREAARLLLLLQRGRRFTDRDTAAVRDATRLWHKPDLVSYIDVGDLGGDDVEKRKEMARFLGDAGIEAARLPLLKLAQQRAEHPALRAAAAEALGGMRIARVDLAHELGRLLRDENEEVRKAAVRGLARLKIRPAAERLIKELGGSLADEVRLALSRSHGRSPLADWGEWFNNHGQALPDGT